MLLEVPRARLCWVDQGAQGLPGQIQVGPGHQGSPVDTALLGDECGRSCQMPPCSSESPPLPCHTHTNPHPNSLQSRKTSAFGWLLESNLVSLVSCCMHRSLELLSIYLCCSLSVLDCPDDILILLQRS